MLLEVPDPVLLHRQWAVELHLAEPEQRKEKTIITAENNRDIIEAVVGVKEIRTLQHAVDVVRPLSPLGEVKFFKVFFSFFLLQLHQNLSTFCVA